MVEQSLEKISLIIDIRRVVDMETIVFKILKSVLGFIGLKNRPVRNEIEPESAYV